ncbi:hypothetical protein Zmor_025444 [Zophobas morio]|uniref:Uncharacterized protein n=1 Tax=Zophobas morio TaxID=2755281 RepID=A0AA38M3Z0_9CUCU|nr:hypothetical protein Zmor_025444 [Zophobas morio]
MNPHKCDHHHHHPSVPEGCYWRDYTGEIPKDAFPGGHDSNGQPTYIGQAYLTNAGVVPANLYRGQSGMYVACNNKANYSDIAMKILCTSRPDSLVWELVIGGYHPRGNAKLLLNIGRVKHGGELIVGKVHEWQEHFSLNFVGDDTELSAKSYQALVVNSSNECC